MENGNLIKRMGRYLVLGFLLVLIALCGVFIFVNVNRPILEAKNPVEPSDRVDVKVWEEKVGKQLRQVPWQGLRYLPEKNEWRFYAITGETRKINLIVPFDLVKIYYLESDGDLDFTWVNTAADFPGKGRLEMTNGTIETGELVEVVLSGEYVGRSGVRWDLCESEYCRVANMIDTIIILDDEGTGITNGFIRNGWEPPTSPMYGFLCWEIRKTSAEEIALTRSRR